MAATTDLRAEPLVFFTVPGAPVPKARPRRARHGKWYTPRSTEQHEDAVRAAARSAWSAKRLEPWTGQLALSVVFWLPTRRRVDLDNLTKLVTDALNGEVYADDSQIWSLEARKAFSKVEPRTTVWLYDIGGRDGEG